MAHEHTPVAHPESTVTIGNARFTVLTPRLIRMEWSPQGRFEDRASYAFIHRDLPTPQFTHRIQGQQLTLQTEMLTLTYDAAGGKFDGGNLTIEFAFDGRQVRWVPGMRNPGNLRGTYRTLDGVSGATGLEPGILSRDGWSLVDDSATTLFDDSDWPWAVPRPDPEALDWYFFAFGHDYLQALQDFTAVGGYIPLPPRYVFGAWWSRYWPYSDQEFKDLVGQFREHGVPLDVLVIDMDWHLAGWTGYTWNPKYFPDPEGFLAWAEREGLRTPLNLHPHAGVGKHEAAFPEFARAMGRDPNKVDRIPFDPTDRRYVDAYFKLLHHPLERQGVDFWWMDWQQGTQSKIPGLDPLPWLNYLHWSDWERNPGPKHSRPLIFSRWGGLGNHRYQIGFSGDTHSIWESLAFQPYFTATAGNVGYAYWSHDIGGHFPGPTDGELYARWIQWGALSPALRTHTTRNPAAERRIWAFEEPYYQAAREAWLLRYDLIPYIYTMCRKTYDESLPLVRPLYYEWPDLDEAYRFRGQYLFGDDMLVAPVAEPLEELTNCASLQIWIPPGTWTNWFTGQRFTGPDEIALAVPLDQIPLFVRDGAIIPAMPRMKNTHAKPVDPLILHIFGGTQGSTRVYEDDGLSDGYRAGECRWTPVAFERDGSKCTLTVSPAEGDFDGALDARMYELRLHDVLPPTEVTVDGTAVTQVEPDAGPGWWYDADGFCLVVRTPRLPVGERVRIRATLHKDAVVEAALASGLRDQLDLVATALRLLGHDAPDEARTCLAARARLADDPAAGIAALHELPQQWPALIEHLAGADLPEPRRTELLTRMLGLAASFEIRADDEDANTAVLMLDVAVRPPFGAAIPLILEAAPFTIIGEGQVSAPVVEESRTEKRQRLSMRQRIRFPNGLTATRVRTTITAGSTLAPVTLTYGSDILPSVNAWWVVGPFETDEQTIDKYDAYFAALTEPESLATYAGLEGTTADWRRVERTLIAGDDPANEFLIDFHNVYGEALQDTMAYGITFLEAPREMEVVLALGTDDNTVVWLNGEEIHRYDEPRGYHSQADHVPVTLQAGTNVLALRVNQLGGGWVFAVHVLDAEGNPVTDVRATLTP